MPCARYPTLNVDAAGNVTFRNGTPVILLDGKQTQLTLDQIPADQIQSIEVMPNPSARYDAQGNHGIVNIVLKKNRKPGMNGSVTAVWNSLHETYGFLNMNMYKNKWNFTLNYMAHGHRSVSNTTTTLNDLWLKYFGVATRPCSDHRTFSTDKHGFRFFHGPPEYLQSRRQYRLRTSSIHRYPNHKLHGREWVDGFQQYADFI